MGGDKTPGGDPYFGDCVRLAEKNKCLAYSNKSARGVADQGRELPAGNLPREPAAAGDIDAALAAVAWATEDEG